ncbi:hypothetical protein HD806DRAFT_520832 [Xylariaceae sp. AK1471]|nr:hypothetical protein HD806DRAFT_520832 [Xylariaceae sp. AK1471]
MGRSLTTKIITQLDDVPRAFENITLTASLYIVPNSLSEHPSLSVVHTFSNTTSVTGITETKLDTFVVNVGSYEAFTETVTPESIYIWEVSKPTVRAITKIPEAGLLNGLATVPGCSEQAVLMSDSSKVIVYRVDVATNKYEIVLDVPEIRIAPGSLGGYGANGVEVHDGYATLDNRGCSAQSGVEAVAKFDTIDALLDDFAMDVKDISEPRSTSTILSSPRKRTGAARLRSWAQRRSSPFLGIYLRLLVGRCGMVSSSRLWL